MGRIVRRGVTIGCASVSLCVGLMTFVGISPGPGGLAGATTVPPTVTASNWTVEPAPTVSQTDSETLSVNGVACPTSNFCVAVGSQGFPQSALIEQWNGSSWASVNAPDPGGVAFLQSVSCAGPSFCIAVGIVEGSTTTVALIEQWNGSAWSIATPAALPVGTQSAEFLGVSCVSSSFCVAVGTITIAGFSPGTLDEFWDGSSWDTTHPAVGLNGEQAQFNAVSCVSQSFCMVAGQQGPTPDPSPLVEQWNAGGWSLVSPATGPGTLGNWFSSVSCAGTSFCELVGRSQNPGSGPPSATFIETWNGQQLTVTPSPNAPSSTQDSLSGVACFSQTACSAVGQSGAGTSLSTLALSWNGSSWSMVSSPNGPGSNPAALNAVSCLTNWTCVAVGQYVTDTMISTNQPFILSASIARTGYRFVASDGGIFNYGAGAPFLGSMGGQHLNKPIVGMAVMPAGDGYYLVASDGGIFSFGSAQFYGSTGSMKLNKPIVGMAVTPDGAGYWLVASDGGIFSYGDAQFYGSTGSIHLNKPIVGMAATPDGKGYYLVASDGGIFNYGDATFQGSAGSLVLNKPVVGMAAPLSGGYYLVASDGGIFTYPTTNGPPFFGSTGSIKLNKPIVGMTAVSNGYYLSASDGGVFTYPTTNGPTFYGSTGSIVLNQPIVGIAG
jgi:hypothetical protein